MEPDGTGKAPAPVPEPSREEGFGPVSVRDYWGFCETGTDRFGAKEPHCEPEPRRKSLSLHTERFGGGPARRRRYNKPEGCRKSRRQAVVSISGKSLSLSSAHFSLPYLAGVLIGWV